MLALFAIVYHCETYHLYLPWPCRVERALGSRPHQNFLARLPTIHVSTSIHNTTNPFSDFRLRDYVSTAVNLPDPLDNEIDFQVTQHRHV